MFVVWDASESLEFHIRAPGNLSGFVLRCVELTHLTPTHHLQGAKSAAMTTEFGDKASRVRVQFPEGIFLSFLPLRDASE